jgi:hypothetical protein
MEMDNVELATTIVQVGKQRPGGSEMVEATAERGKEERVLFPQLPILCNSFYFSFFCCVLTWVVGQRQRRGRNQ